MKKVFRLSLVVVFMCILVSFAISVEMMEKAEETEMQYTMMPMQEMKGEMGRPAMRGMGPGHGMMCGNRGMMNMPMMRGMMACSGMKDMPVMEDMKMGHGMMCPMCGKMMGRMGGMSKMVDMVADKIELSE
ncbi:hypothetical protein GF312_18135, partial [Candidatus Poribacteria bacterium]|nr:hypothetical protein [Candidatus Poribacteria bacterium]